MNRTKVKATPIDSDLELRVRNLARSLGFADTPLAGDGTHQIELLIRSKSGQEAVYIARLVAHAKGMLQVVVRPEIGGKD